MSATQVTVTSTQVAVRYRQNVGSLSIDISTDCQTKSLGRHIDRDIGRVLVETSADISVNMSTDISVEHRSICRPTLDRYVGGYVNRYIVLRVHKIHMILDSFVRTAKKL